MVLTATVVLFLVIMLTHEGSSRRFFHQEEKNIMNKNHLLHSLQDQVRSFHHQSAKSPLPATISLLCCTESLHWQQIQPPISLLQVFISQKGSS